MASKFTRSAMALALLAALGGAAVRAEEPLPHPAFPDKPATTTSEPSWFTPAEGAACRQWSDGCHVCIQSSTEVAPSCSTPGIACVQNRLALPGAAACAAVSWPDHNRRVHPLDLSRFACLNVM